jgi:hypothetical protein
MYLNKKLKIGIIANSPEFPFWLENLIKKIENSISSELNLIMICENKSSKKYKLSSFFLTSHIFLDKIALPLDNRLKRNVYRGKPINHTETIQIRSVNTKKGEYSYDRDLSEKILKYNLDIILSFEPDDRLSFFKVLARYGIWVFTTGNAHGNIVPQCYWELIKQTKTVIKVLMFDKYCADESGAILFVSSFDSYSMSINRSINQVYKLSPFILFRLIENLHFKGKNFLDSVARRNKLLSMQLIKNEEEPPYPSNTEALVNLLKIASRIIQSKFPSARIEKWFILFKISKLTSPLVIEPLSFKLLKPPHGRIWADPFVVSHEDRIFIFVEESSFHILKGHISVLELDLSGNLIDSNVVLEKPYHLSYPFVFVWDNDFYMIPESSSNRTIELYKVKSFPYEWEFQMNLMENINASDTTLLFYDKKWWLFTALRDAEDTSSYSELFIYYSDNLLTDKWVSHPLNPISSDIENLRPAGRIFSFEGKLYRPSQDCVKRYGRAINVNEITRLDDDSYSENLIQKIEPDWDKKIKGVHTLNFDKNIILMDAYRHKRKTEGFITSKFRSFATFGKGLIKKEIQ